MTQNCDYWEIGHLTMNCKNCMVLNKEYCKEKFEKASKPKKCEFFDLCKHKFIRPRNTIINHKEEDLDIKAWCTDLDELKPKAQCVIREEVLAVLVRGVY